MIDLKKRIELELSRIEPPDLWERIQAEASNDAAASVLDLTNARRLRRTSLWLAAAAAVVAIALIGALTWSDDDQRVDTVPADAPSTTTPEEPVWSGPVRDPSDVVHRMAPTADQGLAWEDPLDASEAWADVVRVQFSETNYGHWTFDLADTAPLLHLEPGVVAAYGLVFDTNADGAADYEVGIANDSPRQGKFRAWVTNLATGETDEQIDFPYGYPIEFRWPSEYDPSYPTIILTFLNRSAAPADLDLNTVRFYAWTSATRDDQVFAHDYAPDTGWISVG